jgi:peroxiredoxin
VIHVYEMSDMTRLDPSIAEQAKEAKAGMAVQLPAEIYDVFTSEQAGLNAAGVPATVAEPGIRVPDAQLMDAKAESVSLRSVTGGRYSVIVFYRGAWCPFCNVALRTYQKQLLPELDARGVSLVAVSPQKPDGSLSMQEKHDLLFPVLSDPGNTLAGALGILAAPAPEVHRAQAQLGLDLTEVNADGTHTLPMPTVAILDADNVLRWIDVHPDYTSRTEPAAVLGALDAIR